jgi:DNA-binding beta-propeller fold protein YncE
VTSTDHPGVYRIHCTPVIRGSHQVNVLIDNIQLESSLVVVPFNPYQEDSITPIHIIEGVDHPFGVAVTEDYIIVTEYRGNCLKILNKEDKSIACSVKIDSSPRGIAITSDKTILVTLNHKIWKISMDGKLINSVGRYGSNPLEFSWPCGIAISPITGYVHVADRYNHRVQVLNPDLTFRFSFGCKGTAQGQFLSPRFIGIDSEGLLYVSDRENHRIQKFTREGHFISLFSMAGSAPGQLKSPESILIENDFLYVSEKDNHRVSVFAMNGSFIRCFGSLGPDKDQFNEPTGMTFDDNNGCLYVCDYNNKRLVVY